MSCYYQKGPLFHSSAGSEAPLPLYCRSGSHQATEPVQISKPVEKKKKQKKTSFFFPSLVSCWLECLNSLCENLGNARAVQGKQHERSIA